MSVELETHFFMILPVPVSSTLLNVTDAVSLFFTVIVCVLFLAVYPLGTFVSVTVYLPVGISLTVNVPVPGFKSKYCAVVDVPANVYVPGTVPLILT